MPRKQWSRTCKVAMLDDRVSLLMGQGVRYHLDYESRLLMYSSLSNLSDSIFVEFYC